jgi:hypothetical protein
MSRRSLRLTAAARRSRARWSLAAVLLSAAALLSALLGCGAGSSGGSSSSGTATQPSYVLAPFTHQQQLVQRGARLYVADGCSACHSIGSRRGGLGPSFAVLAGNRVTLADGHSVLVDERFLRAALTDPASAEVRGYAPGPMLAAVRRLRLRSDPAAVAALAAFIEQIGPETP